MGTSVAMHWWIELVEHILSIESALKKKKKSRDQKEEKMDKSTQGEKNKARRKGQDEITVKWEQQLCQSLV